MMFFTYLGVMNNIGAFAPSSMALITLYIYIGAKTRVMNQFDTKNRKSWQGASQL